MKFTFDPPLHPTHGTEPVAIREIVPGWASLNSSGDHYEYGGGTEMLWDCQKPDLSENQQVLLKDRRGRTWRARLIKNQGGDR